MFDTLVISGGSLNGLSIIGSLMYISKKVNLDEIHNYIGTSVGSIITYLLILGYKSEEIIMHLIDWKSLDVFDKSIPGCALSMWQNGYIYEFEKTIEPFLEKMTLQKLNYIPTLSKLYEQTQKSFTCFSYNMTNDSIAIFTKETHPEMNCIKAIHLSSAIPLFFKRAEYNNECYVDGGILENFPLLEQWDKKSTLGIYVDHWCNVDNCESTVGYINEVFNILQRRQLRTKLETIHNSCLVKLKSINTNLLMKIDTQELLNIISNGFKMTKDPNNRNFMFI